MIQSNSKYIKVAQKKISMVKMNSYSFIYLNLSNKKIEGTRIIQELRMGKQSISQALHFPSLM